MIRKHIYFLPALLLMISCGGQPDKKTELENLEKEYAALGAKIRQLQAELAKSGKNKKELAGRSVAATTVEKQAFVHSIDVLGMVDGEENVQVSAEMPGTVTRLNVSVGDKVSKGQILAELDNGTMVQTYEEVKSQRDFAQTLYEKQKRLWDQNIGSEVQYLNAKNNLDALNKKLATISEQIDLSRLRSPISGTVDEVDIKLGQMLAPGMPGIHVVNTARLKLRAEMAESYITRVKAGTQVTVEVPDAMKKFETKVKYSGQAVNALNRTFNVEIPLTAREGEGLFPNMTARLQIVDYENKEAIVLPLSAVLKSDKGDIVYVAVQEKSKWVAHSVLVKTGLSYGKQVEILEGLNPGDKVITTGQRSLNDGEEINFGK